MRLFKLKYKIKIYFNVLMVNLILPKKEPPPLALSFTLFLTFKGNSLITR